MTEKKPPVQPTPRRERRSRSAEEDAKALAWKLLREDLDKDPQARQRYIAQVTGFDIAKAHREAIEEESHLEFLKLGLKEIQKEPDWAKELARDAIYQAMGKKPPEPEEAKPRETFEQYMERMLKIKDFVERMKPKPPGFWDQVSSAFTPENLSMLFQSMNTWFSQSARNQNPSSSGAYSNETPPQQTTEEQTNASGFAGFGYEPPSPPPPAGSPLSPFPWPPTGKNGKSPWEAGQTTPPGSSRAANEQSQPDTAMKQGSAKDVNSPPNARGETGQWSEASRHGTKPEAQSPNEVDSYPDQSAPLDFKTDKDSGPSAETLENGKPDDLEIDEKAAPIQPVKPPEVVFAELKALFEKTRKTKRDMADTEVLQPRPDRSENNEKAESKMEVESAPSATPPPQYARPKRAEPDFVPDPTPEALEELDKRRDLEKIPHKISAAGGTSLGGK